MQHKKELLELDVWRGMAIIFMIVNHAGYALIGGWQALGAIERTLVFVGSFAPVLFFFITGFGYGISHARHRRYGTRSFDSSVWYKAAVLVLMDLLIRQGFGAEWYLLGWDFLGFIAISMILLCMVRRLRAPVAAAVLLASVLVALRYGVGPLLEVVAPAVLEMPVISVLLGLQALDGVSYWFTPWLVYPLGGFIAGYAFNRYRELLVARQRPLVICLAATTAAFLLMAGLCAWQGMIFFRWGTVSTAYFILSFGVLGATALVALAIGISRRGRSIGRVLAQRGVSSLAVVPVHYALIYCLGQSLAAPLTTAEFLLMLVGLVGFSYLVARYISSAADNLVALNLSPALIFAFLGGLALLTVTATWLPLEGVAKISYLFALELVLCFLLPLRPHLAARSLEPRLAGPRSVEGK